MEVNFATMDEKIVGTTCVYWLAGRCNRNPCRFLHKETTSSYTFHHNANRNPCRFLHKETTSSYTFHHNASGKSRYYGKRSHSSSDTIPNSKTTLIKKSGDKGDDMSVVKVSKKSSPSICKYWTNNNCAYGEKCLNLHSWSQGDGFSTLTKFYEHKKVITGITLPVGSDKLYSGSTDGTVRIWDCHTSQCVRVKNFGTEVTSLISEGPWIFVGLNNAIKAWNIENNSEFTLYGPKGQVLSMTVGNNILFAGAEDGVITAWRESFEANSPFELVASLTGHTKAVACLTVGRKMLYSGSRDQSIKVWDMDTLQCTMTLNEHTDVVTSLICWDNVLLSSSSDCTIKIWACLKEGTLNVVYTHMEQSGFVSLFGMHDAEGKPILFCSCRDSSVHMYELPSFLERGYLFAKKEVTSFELAPGGLFLTGDGTGLLRVWKWSELSKVASS